MKIYVVRHGKTKWNQEKRMQGIKNSDLIGVGIEEAKKLGEYLKDVEFEKVWTSPLGRCLETTGHVVGDRSLDVEKLDGLHEFNFGEFEGKTIDEIEKKYPEENYNLWNKPEAYVPVGGEDFEDLFKRVGASFNEIVKKSKGGNTLVVTHGVYISALLAMIENKEIKDIWEIPIVDNTSLTIIEVLEGEPKIISMNNTEYLK